MVDFVHFLRLFIHSLGLPFEHVKLVSLKNIDFCPIYGPISIIFVANFYPILIKLCICVQETSSYK